MTAVRLGVAALLIGAVVGGGFLVTGQRPSVDTGAELVQSLQWPEQFSDPGGLSGLVVTDAGGSLIAVSDTGMLVHATIQRDDTGRMRAISTLRSTRLLRPVHEDWPDNWYHRDAEGLAVLSDGTLVVSFEGLHRVNLHDGQGNFVLWLPVPEEFSDFEVNTGLEGIAATADGILLSLPEVWDRDPGQLPLFRFDGTHWQIQSWISAMPPFRPVGLDIDRAGRLYVLERAFSVAGGFRTQIRRFAPMTAEPPTGPLEGEVLLRTRLGEHGNLEGLSLWERADGALIATMIADNNTSRFMRRELVEYRLATE